MNLEWHLKVLNDRHKVRRVRDRTAKQWQLDQALIERVVQYFDPGVFEDSCHTIRSR